MEEKVSTKRGIKVPDFTTSKSKNKSAKDEVKKNGPYRTDSKKNTIISEKNKKKTSKKEKGLRSHRTDPKKKMIISKEKKKITSGKKTISKKKQPERKLIILRPKTEEKKTEKKKSLDEGSPKTAVINKIDKKKIGKKDLSPMAKIKHAILDALRLGEESMDISKSAVARIPSGIPGLDQELQGGLIKNSVTLVSGSPGAGKSIFAMQFLVKGAEENDEPGVYVSFEEEKEDVYRYMLEFGWDLNKLEKQKKFAFIRYTPEQVNKVLKEGGGIIDNIIRKIKAKRIVIDSITAFTLLFKDDLAKREGLLELFKMIEQWGCTTFVTSEQEADPEKHRYSVEEFEVDGVILLYYQRKKNVRERVTEILKMRGTKVESKIFPMKITEQGIVLYPEESVF